MADRIKIKVKNNGGILQNKVSVAVKGTNLSIKSIEDIGDVDEISVEEGATVVYNEVEDKYEIKRLDVDDLEGDFNLDGGEF